MFSTEYEWQYQDSDGEWQCVMLDLDYDEWEEDDGTAHDHIAPRRFTVPQVTQVYCAESQEAETLARNELAKSGKFSEEVDNFVNELD